MFNFWHRTYNIDELKKFYRNELINTESMYLRDMWCMSYRRMEKVHNYIQWMFPINEKSNYNKKAPVLTSSDIEVLKADDKIMNNFRKSIIYFLDFLGMNLNTNDEINLNEDFLIKSQNWLTKDNHNYKRITRLLIFLRLFEFNDIAHELMCLLTRIYEENKDVIGEATYNYWLNAMNE